MLDLLGNPARLDELEELGLDVVGAPDLPEHGFPFLVPAPFDETVRGVHHQEGSYGEEASRDPR